MTLEDMISKLDEACERLMFSSINNDEIYIAKEMIMDVSIALGEVKNIEFYD